MEWRQRAGAICRPVAAVGPFGRHVRIAAGQGHAALAGLVDEQRALGLGQVVDGAQRCRMAVGERRPGIAGQVLAHVDGVAVAARWHADIEDARQQPHAAQRPVAAQGRMHRAPAPAAQIAALHGLQAHQRPVQRLADLGTAACSRAPPAVAAFQHAFDACAVVALAIGGRKGLCANARDHQAAREFVHPGGKDQGRGLRSIHAAVELRHHPARLPGQRMCGRRFVQGLEHLRQQGAGGQRGLVVLDGGHADHVVPVLRIDEFGDALVPVRQAPVLGEEVGIALARDALVGGGQIALRRSIVLRGLVVGQPALPVVACLPARRGRHAAQVVVGRAQRHRPAALKPMSPWTSAATMLCMGEW